MRFVVMLSILAAAAGCGSRKLDRAELDKIVKLADRCAKDNDLMCVLQEEHRVIQLAGEARDLGQEDQDYFNQAAAQVQADVKTVENNPPGRPPTAK